MRAWTARDENELLYLHYEKPYKRQSPFFEYGEWYSRSFKQISDSDLPTGVNPQWSDKEPVEVELKIERV